MVPEQRGRLGESFARVDERAFRSSRQEFAERIRLARNNHTVPTNCIGTALFLVGLQGRDAYKSDYAHGERDITPYLEKLKRVSQPKEGDLICWESEICGRVDHNHMAVVLSVDPFRYIERSQSYVTEKTGKFARNFELGVVKGRPRDDNRDKVRFYRVKDDQQLSLPLMTLM